jgi:hypothetical protein
MPVANRGEVWMVDFGLGGQGSTGSIADGKARRQRAGSSYSAAAHDSAAGQPLGVERPETFPQTWCLSPPAGSVGFDREA